MKGWYLTYKRKTLKFNAELLTLTIIIVLNGQTSSRQKVLPGVPQASALGPCFFLIYIPEGIESICKVFADVTLLFSIAKKDNPSQNNLNSDFKKSVENAFSSWSQKASNGGLFLKEKKIRTVLYRLRLKIIQLKP